jgi:hypothetical protein
MYNGSRRSHAQNESMEDLYKGSIQDIKEGCVNEMLAIEDPHGYPLCITKFINFNK